jgi:hypothetical protein
MVCPDGIFYAMVKYLMFDSINSLEMTFLKTGYSSCQELVISNKKLHINNTNNNCTPGHSSCGNQI